MIRNQSPTFRIAEWIAGEQDRGRFCDDARRVAAKSIIDMLGCMLAGTREKGPRRLAGTLTTDPKGPCSLIGLGTGAASSDAALVNGMLAHVLDYDDTHW